MGTQAQGGRVCQGRGGELTVKCSWFMVHDSQITVHDSHFTVHESQFMVHNSQIAVHDSQFTVHVLQFMGSIPGRDIPKSLKMLLAAPRYTSLSKTLYSPKVLVNYPGSDGSVPT